MVKEKTVTDIIDIEKIQPSQLYILKEEYDKFNNAIIDNYEPISIKKIRNKYYLLGNHELLLYLANNGIKQVRIYYNNDKTIDMIAYFTKVQWCQNQNIHIIKDLSLHIINKKEYKKKWEKRCDKLSDYLYKNALKDITYVNEITKDIKEKICNNIITELPEWFQNADAIKIYNKSVREKEFIKIELFNQVIGFVAYEITYGLNCYIYLMGIYKPFHRYGIGSKLIAYLNNILKQQNIKYISIKSKESYIKTHNFYIKNGFYPFYDLKTAQIKEKTDLLMIKEVN